MLVSDALTFVLSRFRRFIGGDINVTLSRPIAISHTENI